MLPLSFLFVPITVFALQSAVDKFCIYLQIKEFPGENKLMFSVAESGNLSNPEYYKAN